MKKYLVPMWIFIGGNVLLLIAFLFLGAIGTATDQLASDSAAYASTFWNWTWVSGTNVKFLVLILLELGVLYVTGKAFLAVR